MLWTEKVWDDVRLDRVRVGEILAIRTCRKDRVEHRVAVALVEMSGTCSSIGPIFLD